MIYTFYATTEEYTFKHLLIKLLGRPVARSVQIYTFEGTLGVPFMTKAKGIIKTDSLNTCYCEECQLVQAKNPNSNRAFNIWKMCGEALINSPGSYKNSIDLRTNRHILYVFLLMIQTRRKLDIYRHKKY